MKTPDEIKKGLECCISDTYGCNEKCPYFNSLSNGVDCAVKMHADALAYIQHLEAANTELLTKCERLERERDAAVKDLRNARNCCHFCKNDDGLFTCKTTPKSDHSCFEWRGVKEE